MPHDPKVIPIQRGRLVLVAERYGTPRVLVTYHDPEPRVPGQSLSDRRQLANWWGNCHHDAGLVGQKPAGPEGPERRRRHQRRVGNLAHAHLFFPGQRPRARRSRPRRAAVAPVATLSGSRPAERGREARLSLVGRHAAHDPGGVARVAHPTVRGARRGGRDMVRLRERAAPIQTRLLRPPRRLHLHLSRTHRPRPRAARARGPAPAPPDDPPARYVVVPPGA
jgi:hypothetical protein